jgi:DNA-binding transcriptional ArsR family regulator
MLARLAAGPLPVHLLASGFPISRPAISRHLRVLKDAGLVRELRRGRENLYALVETGLDPVRQWLGPEAKATLPSAPPTPRAAKGTRARPSGAALPQLSLFDETDGELRRLGSRA